jgi:ribosomal protein S18 acetylase RimI-like enzyme
MDHALPERIFADPVWHALESTHRRFAVSLGEARRYPADIAPFAAVASPTRQAFDQLRTLMAPGESIWIFGPVDSSAPGLFFEQTVDCYQMVLSPTADLPATKAEVGQLSGDCAPEMVELTNLAFPGFFRERTYEMGSYFGVRFDGKLVAMGGERMRIDEFVELSAVCTHPAHRGKGYAASIIGRLAGDHRRDGLVSWLHVSCTNRNAIQLYLRLGFEVVRKIGVSRLCRKE